MPGPLAVPIIQAGANVGSNVIGAIAQGTTNRKSRKWSEKMYERQKNDNLIMWGLQNHYNSPEEQMKRLKRAGLNPNLVYGDGGAVTTASPIKGADKPDWNPRAPQFDLSGLGSAAMSFYDIQLKKAQTDNVKAQTQIAIQDQALRAAQVIATTSATRKTEIDTEQAAFNLRQSNSLNATVLEAAAENLRKVKTETGVIIDRNEREAALNSSNLREAATRILNLRAQTAKTEEEKREIQTRIKNMERDINLKDLDIELKRNGIQPGDAIYWRVLGRLLGAANQSLQNILR